MILARLVGGAGTGKTTELIRIIEKAKSGLGGDPFSVGFTSVTRAARAEAVSRASAAWGLDEEVLSKGGWFRTTHSIAYRQLEVSRGEILSGDKESAVWIAEQLGVNVRTVLDEDTGEARYAGDRSAAAALNAWNLARVCMEPLEKIVQRLVRLGGDVPAYSTCLRYIDKYETSKRLHGRCDFVDLLARYGGIRFSAEGWSETDPEGDIPKGVKAWVFDEQQDASALVDRVCRRLISGEEVRYVYVAGDPMQAVFSFSGSDSRFFMGWKADKERVMPKSWRCPAPVHALGEKCLQRMIDGYWDRGIQPADHDGVVARGGMPEMIAPTLDPSQETLILGRCNYLVEAFEAQLARANVPFLRLKSKDTTKTLQGYNALWKIEHGEPVDPDGFAAAVALLPATGNMRRGAKAEWSREDTLRRWDVVLPSDLEDAGFKPEFANRIRAGKWANLVNYGERWRAAAKKYGAAVATSPRIRTGTIHAAKGMEADTVVLSTALSRRIHESQARDRGQHDEERRIEYVGVTRARRKLIVSVDPRENFRMRLPL